MKNAYELYLSIPNLNKKDRVTIEMKLNQLVKTMKHDDFYCMDSGNEYPLRPY